MFGVFREFSPCQEVVLNIFRREQDVDIVLISGYCSESADHRDGKARIPVSLREFGFDYGYQFLKAE